MQFPLCAKYWHVLSTGAGATSAGAAGVASAGTAAADAAPSAGAVAPPAADGAPSAGAAAGAAPSVAAGAPSVGAAAAAPSAGGAGVPPANLLVLLGLYDFYHGGCMPIDHNHLLQRISFEISEPKTNVINIDIDRSALTVQPGSTRESFFEITGERNALQLWRTALIYHLREAWHEMTILKINREKRSDRLFAQNSLKIWSSFENIFQFLLNTRMTYTQGVYFWVTLTWRKLKNTILVCCD